MPLVEYICRNQVEHKDDSEMVYMRQCGHKQEEIRGKQVAGGNDPVLCEKCGSDKMEAQIGAPGWINMGGRQNLKKGWN